METPIADVEGFGARSIATDPRFADPDRSRGEVVGSAVAAVLAAVLSLIATRSGTRATQDSANYLAMAGNVFGDGALTGVSGTPVTVFPPGYPALLAMGDPVLGTAWQRVLLAVCAAITVLCAAALVRRHVTDARWTVVAALWVALAPALGLVWMTTWSEGPFVAATAVFLVAVDRLWWTGRTDHSDTDDQPQRHHALGWFLVALAACWAAASLRYVGVAAVPVLGLVVATMERPVTRRRIALGLGSVGAALVVPALIVTRNLATDGSVAGIREGSRADPASVLAAAVRTVLRWFVPGSALVAVVAVAGLLIWLATGPRGPAARSAVASVAPVVWTGLALSVCLVASSVATALDGMDDRMLSAVLVPIVVVLIVVVDAAAGTLDAAARRTARLVAVLWLCLPAVATLAQAAHPPRSIATSRWRSSELMAAAQDLPVATVVASNRPEALWLTTGRDRVVPVATTDARGWEPADPDAREFSAAVACSGGSLVLVWFDGVEAGGWIPPSALPPALDVEQVGRFDDGELLRITSSEPCRQG